MQIVGMGTSIYESPEELTYNFLNALELSVLPNGNVVDFATMYPNAFGQMVPTEIKFGDKCLKATIDPENVKYAGENEVMLEILGNIKQDNYLLGYLLDKIQLEGANLLSFYNMETEDEDGNRMISATAKFSDMEVSSKYYYNKCLTVIGLVFELAQYDVDLSNFDVKPSTKRGR